MGAGVIRTAIPALLICFGSAAAGTRAEAAELHADIFGNVEFGVGKEVVDAGAFAVGGLDVLVSGSAEPGLRGLAEALIEGEEDGDFEIELERLQVTYEVRDFLAVSAGKIHTPIGSYNTTYHHGRFLETAATRPVVFRFEDDGGILPAHSTGLFLAGTLIGPGDWQWTYNAGLANGRAPSPINQELVHDQNSWKALLLRLSVRAAWMEGLSAGLSAYFDKTPPGEPPDGLGETTSEQTYAAHAEIRNAPWEILAEFVTMRRLLKISQTEAWSRGGFLQLGYGLGLFTPYGRVEFLDADSDPYVAQSASPLWVRSGRLGVRYDPASALALKLEGAMEDLRGPSDGWTVSLQAAFTF